MGSEDYHEVVTSLRKTYNQRKLFSYEARLKQLQALYALVEENKDELNDAVYKDLRKKLKDWMKPEDVKPDLLNTFETCRIYREPFGVVLIMGAWNYPLQLIFCPMVGALAAGNCIVVKPSELSPYTEACLTRLIHKYMDPEYVRVICGGVQETTDLLKERFDKIFYTGSTMVGKIVMKAASQHLTPVDLELGGKCPAIIDETCNFDTISNRIAWAKFCNSGQTCLAPDYVLCIGDCQTQVIESLKKSIEKFYGEDAQKSDSYGRMVNKKHFQRVQKLIDPAKVVYGNKTDENDLYISPTIMTNVTADDLVMQEEIFGPILPIISIKSVEEAIEFVQDGEKPLALYIFSKHKKVVDELIKMTSSGGVGVNDALMHAAVPTLPFGGVGNSGMGAYHGYFSYDGFSHRKSTVIKKQNMEALNVVRYPPYDFNWKPLQFLLWLLTPSHVPKSSFSWLKLAFLGFMAGFIYNFVVLKEYF